MGVAVWIASGALLFLIARFIPPAETRSAVSDFIAALVGALLAGLAATALDFGGWREADWRAGLFAFVVAAAAVAAVRLRAEWRVRP